jgi:uncharacterized membrane protein YdbT with pleckstrin-like domain
MQAIEKVLLDTRPAMFRQHPIGFIITILLCFVGVGFLILLGWWLTCKGQRLIVTNRGCTYREGILAKRTSDVRHADVRHIVVTQGVFQRMFGVGNIGISSAGESEFEIEIAGVEDPQKIKDLVNGLRAA